MRSGDSVLKALSAAEGAPPPASVVRRANLTYLASVELNVDGIADMRSGGSVLEAPPGAEEGALPREHRPQVV